MVEKGEEITILYNMYIHVRTNIIQHIVYNYYYTYKSLKKSIVYGRCKVMYLHYNIQYSLQFLYFRGGL